MRHLPYGQASSQQNLDPKSFIPVPHPVYCWQRLVLLSKYHITLADPGAQDEIGCGALQTFSAEKIDKTSMLMKYVSSISVIPNHLLMIVITRGVLIRKKMKGIYKSL